MVRLLRFSRRRRCPPSVEPSAEELEASESLCTDCPLSESEVSVRDISDSLAFLHGFLFLDWDLLERCSVVTGSAGSGNGVPDFEAFSADSSRSKRGFTFKITSSTSTEFV